MSLLVKLDFLGHRKLLLLILVMMQVLLGWIPPVRLQSSVSTEKSTMIIVSITNDSTLGPRS